MSRARRLLRLVGPLGLLAVAGACSAIDYEYALHNYRAQHADAVKRIVIGAWAPEPGVGELAARIATDMVRLHKNYLVYEPVALQRGFGEACGERQGVLEVRVLDLVTVGDDVTVRASVELFRCGDGRLLWRTEGEDTIDANEEALQQLTAVYRRQLGAPAQRYAAPLFSLLKELTEELPNPELTEEEVIEKIELGALPASGEAVATR